jgi:glycosyltransferase involved in cell wall biosynthesis
MPFFTVGVPTYNRAHLLRKTLACLKQQTFKDVEFVVSDNASTDDTEKVVQDAGDARIRYVKQPETVPLLFNIKRAADEAKGEWFVLNQDDDFLAPTFLERCYAAISSRPSAVMYASDLIVTQTPGRIGYCSYTTTALQHRWENGPIRVIPGPQVAAVNLFTTVFHPPAQAVLRSVYLNTLPTDPAIVAVSDRYQTGAIALNGDVLYEAAIGGVFRQHSGQYSAKVDPTAYAEASAATARAIIAGFDRSGLDWRPPLREVLQEVESTELGQWFYWFYFTPSFPLEPLELLAQQLHGAETARKLLKRSRDKPGKLEQIGLPKPAAHRIRGLRVAFRNLLLRWV